MRKFILFTPVFFVVLSGYSSADNYSVHFSEDGITKISSPTNNPSSSTNIQNLSESEFLRFIHEQEQSKDDTYIVTGAQQQLNTGISKKEAEVLANSIEFEVYKFSENKTSHTVFESGAGICRGYKSSIGVDVTDSRTYYFDKKENEYYASISNATVYEGTSPKYTQYAPLFNIKNPNRAQNIQSDESKYGRNVAQKNLEKTTIILPINICK